MVARGSIVFDDKFTTCSGAVQSEGKALDATR
jgi:hypothetical protein